MENMVIFVIVLPVCILFSTAVCSLGMTKNPRLNWLISMGGQIGALGINTMLIFLVESEITYNTLQIEKWDVIFIEFILIFGFIIFLSIQANLKITHSADLVYPNYLLFLAAMISLFLTENLLVISTAYIILMVTLGGLYFYGSYKKQISTMRRYFTVVGISSACLILINLGTYLLIEDLSFAVILHSYQYLVPIFQYLLFGGYILGFGLICGIVPILNFHLKEYFHQANPIAFRSLIVLFYPVSGLITLKILNFLLYGNRILTDLTIFLAIIGIIIIGIQILRYLFGKQNPHYRSIFPIVGNLSIIEYHVFLLLGAINQIIFHSDLPILDYSVLVFIILLITSKSLLIESLSPIFDMAVELTLNNLGGFRKYFPQFLFFILIVPLLYAGPFLPGYLFLENLLKIIPPILINQPIQTAELWMSFYLIIGYMCLFLLTLAIMMNEIFFGNSKYTQSEVLPKIHRKYYYPPLIICGVIVFLIIWLNWGKSVPISFYS